jgi:uncharacterized protein YggE
MAKTELDVGPSVRFLIFPILIALSLAFIGYAILQGAPQRLSLITVSASGSVSAVPSQAQMTLFLNATGATAAGAVSNLSAIAGSLNTTLLPFLNGNASAIQTQSYNVYPASNCTPAYYPAYPLTTTICPSPFRFYKASEYLLVTLPEASSTDSAVSALSAIGGISISGISAKLSAQQQSGMQQQALSLAIANATGQASALSGGRQVTVQNITVQGGYVFYPNYGTFSAASAASNQTFFVGRATVTKSIYVVFNVH